jgi:hypothetical protein
MNWEILLFSFAGIVLVFAGMSIGVIISNKRIKGSCGGIGLVMGDSERPCDFCGKKDECTEAQKQNCDGSHFEALEDSNLAQ